MIELHTSDLDVCPGRAVLRREGRYEPRAPGALLRGLIAHECLRLLHSGYAVPDLLEPAKEAIIMELDKQGREPTDSALESLPSTMSEIMRVLEVYERRILPLTHRWTLLGLEVPVNWELSPDIYLASHMDAVWLNEAGHPVIWDWKWRKDSPTIADLGRNLQLAAYWGAMQSGLVLLDECPEGMEVSEEDDERLWCKMSPTGDKTVLAAWIDLPSLKPYSRATIGQDDTGRAVQFQKGDDRPLTRVIRGCHFQKDNLPNVRKELLRRGEMLRPDQEPLFIPQPGMCAHCECEAFCPRFDMVDPIG